MVHQREFDFWGNPKQGALLRELGIDASEFGNDEWVDLAEQVVYAVCKKSSQFTTDRVWFYLEDAGRAFVREPRALGAAMRRAAKSGWCAATDRSVKSVRSVCHRRDLRVWKSLIGGGINAT